MNSINIALPDGISESEAKLLLAIKLYEEGRISSGEAAELAGYSILWPQPINLNRRELRQQRRKETDFRNTNLR